MLKGLARLIGGSNEGVSKKIKPEIEQINILEAEFEQLSDEQAREK